MLIFWFCYFPGHCVLLLSYFPVRCVLILTPWSLCSGSVILPCSLCSDSVKFPWLSSTDSATSCIALVKSEGCFKRELTQSVGCFFFPENNRKPPKTSPKIFENCQTHPETSSRGGFRRKFPKPHFAGIFRGFRKFSEKETLSADTVSSPICKYIWKPPFEAYTCGSRIRTYGISALSCVIRLVSWTSFNWKNKLSSQLMYVTYITNIFLNPKIA